MLALLVFSCALFAESRIEALVPHLKGFVEEKAEKALGGKFDISIGGVEGGLVHSLTLKDCRIRDKSGLFLFQSLDIIRIKSGYTVWNFIADKISRRPALEMFSRDSDVYITFASNKMGFKGAAGFKGNLDNSQVRGYVEPNGGGRIDFIGAIRESSFSIELKLKGGTVTLDGVLADDDTMSLNVRTNHYNFYGFDLVCDAVIGSTIERDSKGKFIAIEGDLGTKSFILNYRPLPDLKGHFRFADRKAEVTRFSVGNGISGHGTFFTARPYRINATILANNANLTRLMDDVGVKDSSTILSGMLNGKFSFDGPVDRVKMEGLMELRKGTIGVIDFDSLTATLRGDGPVVYIEESRITRQSGYFALAGQMDMRKFGKASLFEDIKLATSDTAINWDDLDAMDSKGRRVSEILMTKKVSDDVSLGFKRYVPEDSVGEVLKDKDQVALEYKLHDKESLKLMMGQDNDFFGFEHKDRF